MKIIIKLPKEVALDRISELELENKVLRRIAVQLNGTADPLIRLFYVNAHNAIQQNTTELLMLRREVASVR